MRMKICITCSERCLLTFSAWPRCLWTRHQRSATTQPDPRQTIPSSFARPSSVPRSTVAKHVYVCHNFVILRYHITATTITRASTANLVSSFNLIQVHGNVQTWFQTCCYEVTVLKKSSLHDDCWITTTTTTKNSHLLRGDELNIKETCTALFQDFACL